MTADGNDQRYPADESSGPRIRCKYMYKISRLRLSYSANECQTMKAKLEEYPSCFLTPDLPKLTVSFLINILDTIRFRLGMLVTTGVGPGCTVDNRIQWVVGSCWLALLQRSPLGVGLGHGFYVWLTRPLRSRDEDKIA